MLYADGRRPPRPTFRVLKDLPASTFLDEKQRAQITAFLDDPTRDIYLYDLDQTLLRDARSFFPDREPNRHKEASKAAKMPVFEVRDHGGAGWRGAVIRDDSGDAWLVYADAHDHFHATVADALSATISQQTGISPLQSRMPTAIDLKFRAREEAALQEIEWRCTIANTSIKGIAAALATPGVFDIQLDATPGDQEATLLRVDFDEHEMPAGGHDGAGLEASQSLVTMEVRCFGTSRRAIDAVLQEVLPLLQNDLTSRDAHYDRHGNLVLWVTLTHAKLTQIVAASELNDPQFGLPKAPIKPTQLHYVPRDALIRAFVQGSPMRSVCGRWFVPMRDEGSDLPVCPDCEIQKPTAQRVASLIRQRLSAQ